MEFLQNFFNNFFYKKSSANPFLQKGVYPVGPNNLAELLKQFDEPVKPKTSEQIIMTTIYTEKFAELELDFLKGSPDVAYQGSWKINNSDGTIDIDFVPCSVRPEVLYCCYGKN